MIDSEQARADAGGIWPERQTRSGAIARMGSDNRWFILVILGLVSILNYIDRTILSILQVPIKAELGLTDAQLGALTGLTFALFYTTLALPIARLADRTTRKTLIAASVLVWSLMTALTGWATSFALLVLLRIGVAIGEAGSVPASHSMISDLFPRERRATALSAWGLSFPAGTMLGLAVGGWLAASIGWRQTFLWIGVTGVVAAPLLLFVIREPVRGRYDPPGIAAEVPAAREALPLLWRLNTFRYAVLAAALNMYVQFAMLSWNAPFYSRAFDMPLASIAGWLAIMNGVGGGIGIYLSGNLSDWLGRRFTRGYLLPPAVGMVLLAGLGLIQYMFAPRVASLGIGIVTSLLVNLYFSCIVSVSHSLVPPRMRAFTSAMIVFVCNLFGVGLGPLVTGAISDWLGGPAGTDPNALRWALSAAMIPALFSGWFYWKAATALITELPAAEHRESP